MLDIDARRNIARVANANALRNWSMRELPCNPMRQVSLSFMIETAISVFDGLANPNATS